MKVSTARTIDNQMGIWNWIDDRPLQTFATVRPYVGYFFEEATRVLTGGIRLRTETGSICPDIQAPDDLYCEVKGVGLSRQSVIFKHRIDKYDRFMEQGNRLVYVFWIHNCKASKCKTLFSLRASLAVSVECVLIVPAEKVHAAARQSKERFTSYSGTHEAPSVFKLKPAYTLTRKAMMQWANQSSMAPVGEVYGCELPSVTLYQEI